VKMKRREVITLLGGAAAAWPALANAQQTAKPPTIGYLGPNSRLLDGQRLSAFVQRLRELGWIEDRTITIEYRWADGRNEHLADIAADFVRRKVDVIVTSATPPTVAAKQATSVIPIVFAAVGDPVGSGVVKSLARPGGNATGLSLQATDAVGKRLQLLGEVITGLRRLAIMANSGNPSAALEMREAEDTARTLGLEGVTSEIRRSEDSRLRSMPLKAAWRPFTSATIHSQPPTGFASALWHRPRGCRPCSSLASMSRREG